MGLEFKIWSIRLYLLFILVLNHQFYSTSLGLFTLFVTLSSFLSYKASFVFIQKRFPNIPEILLKRIFSGLSASLITPSVFMALGEETFVHDESKFAISKWMLTALGLELGCLLHDSFFLTKKQLEIPALIVHHLGAFTIFHWIIYRNTVTLWFSSVYILLMEGPNPFWYLHWSLLSTGAFKSHMILFTLNYLCTVSTYIYLRFMIVHVRIFEALWAHYSVVVNENNYLAYAPDLFVAVGFQVLGFGINVLNTYKLTRSFVGSFRPVDEERKKK